jgi:hypothetical protein
MKLKLNKDGSAVVRDGIPVYIRADGTEQGIDGAAAWKLALGKHFETSPVMAGLKIPHDLAAAAFSDSFRIEGGKVVAVDKLGIQLYSGTRHGEVANFDEAFAQLVDRYPSKAMILREDVDAAPAHQQPGTGTVTRAQFDAMPQDTRGRFLKEGGRIGDAGGGPTPGATLPGQQDGAKTMTREQFDVTPPPQIAAFLKSGGKVVD